MDPGTSIQKTRGFWNWMGASALRIGFGVLLLVGASVTRAATLPPLTVAWKPNPETNIAAYELSFGTVSGDYTVRLHAGLDASVVVYGLTAGVRYYFVVSAINRQGLRSLPSDEISYVGNLPDENRSPVGLISAPSTDGTIIAGQTVDFSAEASDPDGDTRLTYRWNFGAGSGIADASSANPGAVTFKNPGTYQVTLTVTDSKGLADPTPDTRTITVLSPWSEIPRSGWKLKYVNSEERNGFAATQSFDGNPATFWHTRWTSSKLPPPHQIQIDLGVNRLVTGFEYLPRQDGFSVGDIGKFEFYVSMDGVKWGKAVAKGKFVASSVEKRVLFKPKKGRFIRLVSLTEANGATDCSVAELYVLQAPSANRAPVALARSATVTRNGSAQITLGGSDADRNPLTYQIVSGPKHGGLSGVAPFIMYRPDSGYTGKDGFSYRISDGITVSKTVTVTLEVNPPGRSNPAALSAPGRASSTAAAEIATTLGLTGKADRAAPVISTEVIDGRKYLTLTTLKSAVPAGRVPLVEVSPNLVDWFSGRNHTTVITDDDRLLRVRDNTPLVPGRKRYIRLKSKRS